MAKKALDTLTETMFYILMAFLEGEKCGTEVVDYVAGVTEDRVKLGPATLYTILAKFEKEKLVEETRVEGRKRTYRLTGGGKEVFEREYRRLVQCVADVDKSGLMR